ncbi:MAG TPA: ribonuclease III [candidate division Zixibacteria bacterium]|nr:ribonuclease III [candidate division Zixibacteria bacterium]
MIVDFLKRLFGRTDSRGELDELAAKFHSVFRYDFNDESLLLEALVHRSYIRTPEGDGLQSYERLEFLGDSALGLIVAEELYNTFPDSSEGELTKLKSLLVNETSLSLIGGEAGLGQFVRLSPEEERSGGRERSSILADCFEAVLGAIYLDGSIEPVRKVVNRLIMTRINEIRADKSQINYKGQLLELLQASGAGTPTYVVIAEEGPDHQKTFEVAINFQGERVGVGVGATKKEAEQRAARQALEVLRDRELRPPESEVTSE